MVGEGGVDVRLIFAFRGVAPVGVGHSKSTGLVGPS